MSDFDDFMNARLDASTAFVNGAAEPLLALSVHDGTATIFPPSGAIVIGAEEVNSGNEHGTAMFEPCADNHFDVVHSDADTSLAYWCGLQRSRVRVKGNPDPVEMNLRVTELFRRVDGQWKLFHRHADMAGQSRKE